MVSHKTQYKVWSGKRSYVVFDQHLTWYSLHIATSSSSNWCWSSYCCCNADRL